VTQPGHSEIASSASYIQCTATSNKQDAYRYISSVGLTYVDAYTSGVTRNTGLGKGASLRKKQG